MVDDMNNTNRKYYHILSYLSIIFVLVNNCFSNEKNSGDKIIAELSQCKNDIQQQTQLHPNSASDSLQICKKLTDVVQRLKRYLEVLESDRSKIECVRNEYILSSNQLGKRTASFFSEVKGAHSDFAFDLMINSANKTLQAIDKLILCAGDTTNNTMKDNRDEQVVAGIPYEFKPESKPDKLQASESTKELVQQEQRRIKTVLSTISNTAKNNAEESIKADREAYERMQPIRTWTEIVNSLDQTRNRTNSATGLPQPRTKEEEQALAMMYVVMIAALPAIFQVDASELKGEISFGWQTLFPIDHIDPFSSDNSIMGVNLRYRQMFNLKKDLLGTRSCLELDLPLYLSWMPFTNNSTYPYETEFSRFYQIDPTIRYWYGRFGVFLNSTLYGLEDEEFYSGNRIGGSLLIGSYDYTCKAYGILNIGYGLEEYRWKSGWEADLDIAINNLMLSFSYNIDQEMVQFCYRVRIPW